MLAYPVFFFFFFLCGCVCVFYMMCDSVSVRKQEGNSLGPGEVCGQRCPSEAHWWQTRSLLATKLSVFY
jgi:hypothetical protein